jgi:putative hemolysin
MVMASEGTVSTRGITLSMCGTPCAECGQAARSVTVFDDHTTTTHESAVSGYCVTIGGKAERDRHRKEGIRPNGYQS